LESNSKPSTVNNKLIIINKFVRYVGKSDCAVKLLKVQRKTSLENTMTINDYERLTRMAKKLNKIKTYCISRVLAETGIRIDELRHVTVEAIRRGSTQVKNKNKIRDIVITKELCKVLLAYCKENNITSGIIFRGRTEDKLLDKSYIWRELKYIARTSEVKKEQNTRTQF